MQIRKTNFEVLSFCIRVISKRIDLLKLVDDCICLMGGI